MNAERWLLPEGIEEVLPPRARRLENLRREVLDLYDRWGYQLIIPPFIEFLGSLLTGAGNDLDLQTFKLTDQISGRLMGVRADMTPQIARIDAHHLKRDAPTRLCYVGTVLQTRGDGFGGARDPLQIGVELYGHAGHESDLEVLALMLETLDTAGVKNVYLDLGHVGIFRALVRHGGLNREQEGALFDALQRKALPEIRELLTSYGLAKVSRDMLLALAELNGGEEVLAAAEQVLTPAGADIAQALDAMRRVAAGIRSHAPNLPVNFDLAELRGYHYHTGLVFTAYALGQGQAVAKGGRYDEIGSVFGRSRPATGFSADLKRLFSLSAHEDSPSHAIYAPPADDAELEARVRSLRAEGERVIRALPGAEGEPRSLGCDRILTWQGGTWRVVTLPERSNQR
jgi:ATP phosphoribosyltransferase regulatory subunit